MKKKFVMAVAAVAMAAVVGVSAFAADGVAVPSITGGDANTNFSAPSAADASETTKKAYETVTAAKAENPTITVVEQVAAVIEVTDTTKQNAEAMKQATDIVSNAATVVGAENTSGVVIRAIGDVKSEGGQATLNVAGMDENEKAVVMYLDKNGNWQTLEAHVENGKLVFKLPYSTSVVLLTKNKAKAQAVAVR